MFCVVLRSKLLTMSDARFFATSGCVLRKDPFWRKLRDNGQAKRIEMIKKSNPYATNVGLRHQLALTDLPDPDDPAYQTTEFDADLGYRLESLASTTNIFQKQIEKDIPRKEVLDKDEVRRIIVKKKYFPDPKEPNLLTWIEKEMMRKLHSQDPITWSCDQLSECFPVTPRGAKHIIRSSPKLSPHLIAHHDGKVKENWKLLAQGKLPNAQPITDHFEKSGYLTSESASKLLPPAEKKELEQTILKEYFDSLKPVKPKLTGKFGMILVQHKARTGQLKPEKEDENVVHTENMMHQNEDFYHSLNQPSPFGQTAYLNASSSKGQKYLQKTLTADEFRRKLWKEMKSKAKVDPIAKTYFEWLKTETKMQSEADKPLQLSGMDALKKAQNNKAFIQKYAPKPALKDVPTLKPNEIALNIEVPKESKKEMYQVNDCFYDANGELIYRVPGLTKNN